jgi:hypothetical protein
MRYSILAPLAVAAGLAVLSAGCTGSSKPTAPVTNVQKPTHIEMGGGKAPGAPGAAGKNPRTLD